MSIMGKGLMLLPQGNHIKPPSNERPHKKPWRNQQKNQIQRAALSEMAVAQAEIRAAVAFRQAHKWAFGMPSGGHDWWPHDLIWSCGFRVHPAQAHTHTHTHTHKHKGPVCALTLWESRGPESPSWGPILQDSASLHPRPAPPVRVLPSRHHPLKTLYSSQMPQHVWETRPGDVHLIMLENET